MNKLDLKGSNIIISTKEYFPFLFKFKNAHPQIDIKIISKEETISKLVFSFDNDAIKTLMHSSKHIEYSKAKKYLKLLRTSNYQNNNELKEIFNIVKNNIEFDTYGIYLFKNKNILLFEDNEDVELKNILKNHDLSFSDFSILDLDIKENDKELKSIYFDNKFEQFFFIFLDIRKKLLEDKTLINKINIIVKDSYDLFYIKIMSKLFNIKTYINLSVPIFDLPEVKNKIKNLYKCKDFHFSEENKNLLGHQLLKKIVDDYELEKLGFDFGYINLLEIATSTNYTRQLENCGILVTNQFSFNLDNILYITNFTSDDFFKVYKDNNVISDKEISLLNANPSYINSMLDKRLKRNYLMFNNIALLSRVKIHLNDNIYASPLEKELNIKQISYSKEEINELIKSYQSFTKNSKRIFDIDYLDKKHISKIVDEYNSYDSRFKGIQPNNVFNKDHYSITNLQNYIKCPFKYYLDEIIPELDIDKNSMYLGTLIHACLEDINREKYDFESSFNRGKLAYLNQIKNDNREITPLEETYIEIAHYWLMKIIPNIRENIENIKSANNLIAFDNDAENKFKITLIDENSKEEYVINGIIDKILFTKNKNKKYYTIIDYKTGNSGDFDPITAFLCQGVQLPLYYLATNEVNGIKHINGLKHLVDGYTFGGFDIEHVYASTFNKLFIDKGKSNKKTLNKLQKLNGLSLLDKEYSYFHSIEVDKESYSSKTKEPSRTKFLNKKYNFTALDANESILGKKYENIKYNFNDLINDTKKAIIETINNIRNCKFNIAPTPIDIKKGLEKITSREMTCSFCSHKDICYKNNYRDYVSYDEKIKEHFKLNTIADDEELNDEI